MSASGDGGYEVVIGLEVHTHLRTRTKLFCGCAVAYGEPPNRRTCPVCLALPGALPVLNEHAVELAARAALATHCTLHPRSIYARKNYFYPDLPKGYQISQYEEPLATGGHVEIALEDGANGEGPRRKRIGLTRIHMEEDAGKSVHDDDSSGDESRMDLNRCGTPLIEIVSEPDLRSPAEAGAYLRALRAILRYAGVSDADMEKGQFRCDVNVSLRPRGGSELGTRTEIKNLNSFRAVEGALEAEIARQTEVLDEGGEIVQATLLYDAEAGETRVMRLKENADDYRYFPEPDLLPLELDEGLLESAREALPELPAEKRERFRGEYGLSDYDARLLVESRALAEYFEAAAAAHGNAKAVANWVLRDVLQWLGEHEADVPALPPERLAALIRLVDAKRITAASAREIFPELAETGADPEALVAERGLAAVSDEGVLGEAADAVLAAHADIVDQYRSGETKVLNFLMGQVMKRTRGKADPGAVREILTRKLTE